MSWTPRRSASTRSGPRTRCPAHSPAPWPGTRQLVLRNWPCVVAALDPPVGALQERVLALELGLEPSTPTIASDRRGGQGSGELVALRAESLDICLEGVDARLVVGSVHGSSAVDGRPMVAEGYLPPRGRFPATGGMLCYGQSQ